MLLGPHAIVGAAIAIQFQNPILGLVFAFLSHFILDRIPHWEYSVGQLSEIKTKGIWSCMPIFKKIFLDISLGFTAIILASGIGENGPQLIVLVFGGFFGILPDGLSFLLSLKKSKGLVYTFLKTIYAFHQSIHFSKEKGPPPLGIGLSTQAIAALLALYLIIS